MADPTKALAALEAGIAWIVTVWVPSLILIAVVRYFAEKHKDKVLAILGYILMLLVTFMLLLRLISIFPDLEAMYPSSPLTPYFPIIVGAVLGLGSINLTRSLVTRLQKMNDQ